MKETGYDNAVALLEKTSTPKGFTAALLEEDNYKRVWTRDSALCGLAALATGKENLVQTFKASIETIWSHQHPAGFIPSNVSEGTPVSYGGVVGRVDNHAWIIISTCQYAHITNEMSWLKKFETAIEKCLRLMNAWEFNGRGLMYVPQSADWADEYFHHGYILYNQALRLWALRSVARLTQKEEYATEAERIERAIETYFGRESFYAVQTERMMKEKALPYWPMGFNPSAFYTQFDLQANALALLLRIGSDDKQTAVVSYVNSLNEELNNLLPSFHPAIEKGDIHIQELANNYAYRFRNMPHQFHNGGLWPVWNGFMSFAISKYDSSVAERLRNGIDETCSQNNWEFNECYHGVTGKPVGVPHCSWSAAGLILASKPSFTPSLILD